MHVIRVSIIVFSSSPCIGEEGEHRAYHRLAAAFFLLPVLNRHPRSTLSQSKETLTAAKGGIFREIFMAIGNVPSSLTGQLTAYNFAIEYRKSALLRLTKYRISLFCTQSEIICTQRWEYPASGWVIYPSLHHPLWSAKEEKSTGDGDPPLSCSPRVPPPPPPDENSINIVKVVEIGGGKMEGWRWGKPLAGPFPFLSHFERSKE